MVDRDHNVLSQGTSEQTPDSGAIFFLEYRIGLVWQI